tara:strand:- start:10023 stop:11597 length:1575 start_codon:yes stop_codon:yes gene_type:complete
MKYDTIIIGAGHNGLVCAGYLAKSGKKVLVVERRDVIGGACVTEEIFPGCKVSRASYVNSLFRPEIIRDLSLKSHGLKFLTRQPSSFTPFPNGKYLFLGSDMNENQKEISKFSKKDAEALPEYEKYLDKIVHFVEPLWKKPPPSPVSNSLSDLWQLGSIGLNTRRAGNNLIKSMADMFSLSAGELLNRWFESEELKATLVTDGVIGAMAGPFSPGTAYVLLHHVFGETDGNRGVWAYVKGGMGALSDAIGHACSNLGVEIRLEAPVKEINVNGTAKGVTLKNGEFIDAKTVISSVDPYITFNRLISDQHLPEDFVTTINQIDFSSPVCKMNLLLSELPDFIALPGKEISPQHHGTIHISPTMDYIEHAYDDAKYGKPSQHPILECTIPTTVDDSLAPEGKHLMGIFCQYAPNEIKDSSWDQEKNKFADTIIDTLTEYAPNFRDSILDYELLTPVDLESIFGLTGGNIFHGAMTINQLFFLRPVLGWANHKTPVKGLYLCGSGCHPGGGVTGAPGRNAANEILKG